MLDITNLYAYRIEELAVGIVKAESYEDAREKVKMAYLKHNDCFDLERDVVEIEKFDGFSYASWRANAVYRTLEDMCDE